MFRQVSVKKCQFLTYTEIVDKSHEGVLDSAHRRSNIPTAVHSAVFHSQYYCLTIRTALMIIRHLVIIKTVHCFNNTKIKDRNGENILTKVKVQKVSMDQNEKNLVKRITTFNL